VSDEDERAHQVFTEPEWDRIVAPLAECGLRMETLVKDALQAGGLSPHTVTHRVKQRGSAERKIERKARTNYALGDVTDLLGLRVITYFDYEVNRAAEIIEQEFDVDRDNSVDKRTTLDPDRFGYLSLHYVVRLGKERRAMSEYRKFHDVRFEIQIRSILQHAWAEIEHDLGYKSEHGIPDQVRRRFSRLAGLLELADEEFANIRRQLQDYRDTVGEAVRDNNLNVPINRDSTFAYIQQSARLAALEQRLARSLGGRRETRLKLPYAEARANELQIVGFRELTAVDHALDRDGEVLWRFVRNRFRHRNRSRPVNVDSGILLLYLAVAEALRNEPDAAAGLVDQLGAGGTGREVLLGDLRSARAEANRG
jgi:ppGpp synthetase/RelA/SpoT-type nucleotidyltranferase